MECHERVGEPGVDLGGQGPGDDPEHRHADGPGDDGDDEGRPERDPDRAAAIANGSVNELNSLVAELSTSAAHRERVFLEGRLAVAKRDLDEASNQLAQFSSKNNTLDMQTEGKAMLDAAGTLAGQLIAAEAELAPVRRQNARENLDERRL